MSNILSHAVLDQAANTIAAQHRDSLSRLNEVVILLPHHHAIPEFIRLLVKYASVSHLVLPRITTLLDWASAHSLNKVELPNSRRQSLIYRTLKNKGWFAENDLWQLSTELLTLFDEITIHSISLPSTEQAFIQRLEEVYKIRNNAFLQFEARLIHELWYAMLQDQNEIDSVVAYHERLNIIAQNPALTLYVIGYDNCSQAEQDFFSAYAAKQSVQFFPLSEKLTNTPVNLLLKSVWPPRGLPDLETRSLQERSISFSREHPISPLLSRISFFAAYSLEQEASAVELIIRRWLAEGKRDIAVIIEDRLVARRARALLERSQILVDDETGWKLSTTSASTVVARWLDVVADDFYHKDFLDLLKSPFIFSDMDVTQRKEFVYQLEAHIRSSNIIAGLRNYYGVKLNRPESERLFERLQEAAGLFQIKRLPLYQWLQRLIKSLQLLGIDKSLVSDLAGDQLLGLLKKLIFELESDNNKFGFSEWRAWLNQQFEIATFRDKSIESSVVFTHLSAARLRHFDGVLLIGADANHLNNMVASSRFFNQEIRGQFGLPTAQDKLQQLRDDLEGLLVSSDSIYVTWQALKDNEPNLLSPYFERLRAWHQLAYGSDLLDTNLYHLLNSVELSNRGSAPALALSSKPDPKVSPALTPNSISASAYNSLINCPYQFYARHMLKLNELDEVQEEVLKRDYGELVHHILFNFHQRYERITGVDRIELYAALKEIGDKAFSEVMQRNYLSLSWKLRWEDLINSYVDWQLAREADGWRWYGGEKKYSLEIPLEDGRIVTLKGRIDRIDIRDDGVYSIIDYKTQNQKLLKERLQVTGEDVQLPVYALLFGETIAEAGYLSIDKDKPILVKLEDNLSDLSEQMRVRLQELLNQIYRQVTLPANGIEQVCQYCEMRGVCRKDYWRDK